MNFDYETFQNTLASIPVVKDRMKKLLELTVSFYHENNRALLDNESDTNGCQYGETKTSPGCAIGRCLKRDHPILAEERKRLGINKLNIGDVCALYRKGYKLAPWLDEMPRDFLQSLQCLHDKKFHWDEDGLTVSGQLHVVTMKRLFNL